jgi:hypothetical protein
MHHQRSAFTRCPLFPQKRTLLKRVEMAVQSSLGGDQIINQPIPSLALELHSSW